MVSRPSPLPWPLDSAGEFPAFLFDRAEVATAFFLQGMQKWNCSRKAIRQALKVFAEKHQISVAEGAARASVEDRDEALLWAIFRTPAARSSFRDFEIHTEEGAFKRKRAKVRKVDGFERLLWDLLIRRSPDPAVVELASWSMRHGFERSDLPPGHYITGEQLSRAIAQSDCPVATDSSAFAQNVALSAALLPADERSSLVATAIEQGSVKLARLMTAIMPPADLHPAATPEPAFIRHLPKQRKSNIPNAPLPKLGETRFPETEIYSKACAAISAQIGEEIVRPPATPVAADHTAQVLTIANQLRPSMTSVMRWIKSLQRPVTIEALPPLDRQIAIYETIEADKRTFVAETIKTFESAIPHRTTVQWLTELSTDELLSLITAPELANWRTASSNLLRIAFDRRDRFFVHSLTDWLVTIEDEEHRRDLLRFLDPTATVYDTEPRPVLRDCGRMGDPERLSTRHSGSRGVSGIPQSPQSSLT